MQWGTSTHHVAYLNMLTCCWFPKGPLCALFMWAAVFFQAYRGSVKPFANFNDKQDAEILHRAMKGIGQFSNKGWSDCCLPKLLLLSPTIHPSTHHYHYPSRDTEGSGVNPSCNRQGYAVHYHMSNIWRQTSTLIAEKNLFGKKKEEQHFQRIIYFYIFCNFFLTGKRFSKCLSIKTKFKRK